MIRKYRKRSGYFRTCPYCGAALDPGEKCDCDGPEQKEARPRRYIRQERNRKHAACE